MPVKRQKKVTPKPEPQKVGVDKVIDLIKWVDNPFKLLTVVILGSLAFGGYFAWDSRQVILNAITNNTHVPKMREIDVVLPIAAKLQKDLGAATVVVYKGALVVNSRTTMLAFGPNGRDKSMDGLHAGLFGNDASRNTAMIAMLNGEVQCAKLVAAGKSAEWEAENGVTFICRGSIPPEMGVFDGYISVGFTKEPFELAAIKTRINLAATDMSR